jgi:hypothetical protein
VTTGALTIALAVCAAQAQVTTSQYNNARTGANIHETILTPRNVNANQFGKLFTFHVDGDVYAQPLYLPSVNIPGKGVRNVVYIATEHNGVYAFDADGRAGEPLWRVSLLRSGVSTVSADAVGCPFIAPEVGITSTPVIDYSTGTLYVLARTKESTGMFSSRYVQRLHALAVTNGVEKFGGPVEIRAPGFEPLRENPRAALLLANGAVYLTWGSSCDVGPYHGWVMAYDAQTLAQKAAFNTSPNADQSGIWQSDTGPAADSEGNVYVVTGNGKFDASLGGKNYGDSVLKLDRNLELRDYFTPFNESELNVADDDLGSGGPILLPDQPGGHRRLLAVAGKGATLYLIDRDQMGRYHSRADEHAVQVVRGLGRGVYAAPAYWNGNLYVLASNENLFAFCLDRGLLSRPPAWRSSTRFGNPGATPAVSANGSRDGIVWAINSRGWREGERPAAVYAWDATNLANELYNSEQHGTRDRAGRAIRFAIPTIANGRVYMGARSEVDVYGLLPNLR